MSAAIRATRTSFCVVAVVGLAVCAALGGGAMAGSTGASGSRGSPDERAVFERLNDARRRLNRR